MQALLNYFSICFLFFKNAYRWNAWLFYWLEFRRNCCSLLSVSTPRTKTMQMKQAAAVGIHQLHGYRLASRAGGPAGLMKCLNRHCRRSCCFPKSVYPATTHHGEVRCEKINSQAVTTLLLVEQWSNL